VQGRAGQTSRFSDNDNSYTTGEHQRMEQAKRSSMRMRTRLATTRRECRKRSLLRSTRRSWGRVGDPAETQLGG